MKRLYQGLAALVLLGTTMAACGPRTQNIEDLTIQRTATPSSGEITPAPTFAISQENSPFRIQYNYPISDSFEYMFKPEPVENLRGTVVDTYFGYTIGDYGEKVTQRPFTWLTVKRDIDGSMYYFIYPTERRFPIGQEIVIRRYWEMNESALLLNNMLSYITDIFIPDHYMSYDVRMDFLIQSSAPDGHTDGVIELNAVDFVSSGDLE
ncbi:TPA: hypothetical protein HA239_00610 [Candidatus Woesearchaeota archaeon]|nr:hypothetical protein QT06_C0001G0163 [archaeon GW2011_AR15]MBS3104034.1 hypothetical protein [Candidatus Woesearchaeota archaeon]HIH40898.1 hypothetical protein [Candidatus Woesearchaeota archaeon]